MAAAHENFEKRALFFSDLFSNRVPKDTDSVRSKKKRQDDKLTLKLSLDEASSGRCRPPELRKSPL